MGPGTVGLCALRKVVWATFETEVEKLNMKDHLVFNHERLRGTILEGTIFHLEALLGIEGTRIQSSRVGEKIMEPQVDTHKSTIAALTGVSLETERGFVGGKCIK
jgi:hypothetical protein